MMTDPIADMLTRLRNANAIGQRKTVMPASRMRVGIAQVLQDEGFIEGYEVVPQKPSSQLTVRLKYGQDGEQVMRHIERISKPGRRVFVRSEGLTAVLRGQGIQVVSTPKGVMSDRRAREENVGGEVLAKVW
jgi:small subunit ribosomal protein S8